MKYLEYLRVIDCDKDSVKSWINSNLANHLEQNPENQTDIEHILDYLASDDAPKRLERMSYEEALKNAEAWSSALAKKGADIVELDDDTETVLDFKDGFKVVKLVGENAYKREGAIMRHCVASYYGNSRTIYSLRDENNMPHATLEHGQQIKGKGNGSISPKYVQYVVKFLEFTGMTAGDNEMRNLGYFNAKKIKNYLHKDVPLFNKKYIHEDTKLIDKDGEEFMSLDILDHKPLISENRDGIKVNFDIEKLVRLSVSFAIKYWGSKNKSQLASSGNYSRLASSGDDSQLASSGRSSQLASSGYCSQLAINGENSIGANIGIHGIIKGRVGNWITLAEYDGKILPICVKSVQIDGKKIKENTWYKLENGKFVEVKDEN